MAITLRATSTVALATRTNTTVSRPAGTTTGDYLVVGLTVGGSTAATVTPPAGWTQIATITYTNLDPWAVVLQLWARFDDGAASWTWTHASRSSQAFCIAYVGVHATTPIDVAATTAGVNNTSPGSTIDAPSQTIVTAGARGIIARGSWDGNAITGPAGWTERLDAPVLWVGDRDWVAAGATGAVTVATGNTGTDARAIIMAALRPAGSAPSQGSASVSWAQTQAATGKRTPKASTVAAWSESATASGRREPKGSAVAAWSQTATGAAVRPSQGAGSTNWAQTALAVGQRQSSGQSGAVWEQQVTASGVAPPVGGATGSATAVWHQAVSAAGGRMSSGQSAAEFTQTVTVGTETVRSGSGVAVQVYTPHATGLREPNGSATAVQLWTITAAGNNATEDRDLHIVGLTEPTTSWQTTEPIPAPITVGPPAVALAAAEPAVALTATEPINTSTVDTAEPKLAADTTEPTTAVVATEPTL